MNLPRTLFILIIGIVLSAISAPAQHEGLKAAAHQSRFGPQLLKPAPDFRRVITGDDVRKYWLRMIPQVNRPSPNSSGYNYAMPHYRKELDERNCLVDDINRGIHDGRAECEAMRHNIRHWRRHGNPEKAAQMQAQLARHEALVSGDSHALNALLLSEVIENSTENREQLRNLLIQQSEQIARLKKELTELKTRLIRIEIKNP